MFVSKLYCANLICSFHDRRLNSTQGEIRVGPSHQVKHILVASLIVFFFFLVILLALHFVEQQLRTVVIV